MPPVCLFDQERTRLEGAFKKAVASDISAMSTEEVHSIIRQGLAPERGQGVINALQNNTKEELTLELKGLVEHCLCRVATHLLAEVVAADETLMGYTPPMADTPAVPNLLELGLWLSTHAVADPGMIFTLLECLVEGSTLTNCQDVFSWVSLHLETLSTESLWRRGKLIMLRTCNDLLRRLSKANNTVLCGRILITLSHFFELSERSALNLSSKTNTHVTKVEEDYDIGMDTGTDAVEPVDRNFHQQFWALQTVFQSPQSLVFNPAMANKPAQQSYKDRFDKFHTTLSKVLTVFESQPLRDGSSGSGLTALDGEGEAYAVKYLTSSKLLHLQLRDPAFRRHFLLQCVILMQYCQLPPKPEMATDNKELQETIKALDKRLWGLIEGMPPNGKEFANAVRLILKREKNWVQWKRQVCPAFERLPRDESKETSAGEAEAAPKIPVKRKTRPPVNYKIKLGNPELDRLWSLSDNNLEVLDCESRKHVHTPTMDAFFAELIEEADPEAQFEEQYKKKNNTVFKWKSHRLIAKCNLAVFSKWTDYDLDKAMPELFKSKHMPGLTDKPTEAAPEGEKAKEGGDAEMVEGGEEDKSKKGSRKRQAED